MHLAITPSKGDMIVICPDVLFPFTSVFTNSVPAIPQAPPKNSDLSHITAYSSYVLVLRVGWQFDINRVTL